MKKNPFLNTLMIGALIITGGCAVDDDMMRNEASSMSSSQVSSAAESACMMAVNSNYGGNVGQLNVISSEFSEANSLVMIDADGERWRCLVSNDGVVQDLSVESGTMSSSRQAGSVAENACLDAVASQTNNNNVTVLSSEFSEANSLVMVGVGENRAPWRCLVSNDGAVAEVMFSGDEGKL